MSESPEPQTGVPTCYRHPGRETYVRCTRCERPICPDCMVSASVGFQCVECVREGNKDIRQATGRFGGQVTTSTYATWALIGLNVLVFLLENGSGSADRFKYDYSLIPYFVADGQYYRLFTSAFLHYGMAHLVLNMWALYAVGAALETWLGRSRFIALYLISAFGGSLLVYWFSGITTATAGASGAVFGLFGAFFVLARRMNLDTRPIFLIIVLNLVFTFVLSNISWQGHIGGLITGALAAAVFAYAPRQNRNLVQWGAVAGFAALFIVLTVLRTAQIL